MCGECGRYLQHLHRKHHRKVGTFYNCYRCPSVQEKTTGRSCRNGKGWRVEELEEQVWEFVSSLLKDPAVLSRGLRRLIEQEKSSLRGDPEKEAKAWLEKLSAIERKRSGFQEMAAEGLMSLSELKDKLTQLNEEREAAEEALEALKLQRDRFEALERDAEALLTSYAGMVPEKLGDLYPEERQRVYRMLRLKVSVCVDGGTKISGVLVPKENFYVENITSPPDARPARSVPPRSSTSKTAATTPSSPPQAAPRSPPPGC